MNRKGFCQCMLLLITILLTSVDLWAQMEKPAFYHEKFRPQFHFSPKEMWTNDPNGMVYYKGVYHLFFQFYPDSTIWGPMHWGHATSPDLVHWTQKPTALFPDSLGYIFSGSAVIDSNNTSGLGKDGQAPMVAIFTHHDPAGEKAGKDNFQNQSIAYSLDEGNTWTKYKGNPVLSNPGIRDFRDPKVMWYSPAKKWIMTLATKDRVSFYSSENLREWTKESEFGKDLGAHGGVWECPDLFPMTSDGKTHWVLLVSINPGGPNNGSATQYFVGQFDGKTFRPYSTSTRWIDYGKDDYAGVTWSNTGHRRIFLGWMSNWEYANQVPTERWRNAMTVPRELKLKKIGGEYYLASEPVRELNTLSRNTVSWKNITVRGAFDFSSKLKNPSSLFRLQLQGKVLNSFELVLSNGTGEELVMGYDKTKNEYFIDRSRSGLRGFSDSFPGRHTAPRISHEAGFDLTILVDKASVELFADGGLITMTEVFFPSSPYNKVFLRSPGNLNVDLAKYSKLNSIWK